MKIIYRKEKISISILHEEYFLLLTESVFGAILAFYVNTSRLTGH